MVLTNAQKEKRYRKNLKARGLYYAMKSKHAERMRIYRQNFTGQAKQDYDKRHVGSQRTYRSKNIRLSGKFVQLISKRISETFGFCHCIEGGFLLRHQFWSDQFRVATNRPLSTGSLSFIERGRIRALFSASPHPIKERKPVEIGRPLATLDYFVSFVQKKTF